MLRTSSRCARARGRGDPCCLASIMRRRSAPASCRCGQPWPPLPKALATLVTPICTTCTTAGHRPAERLLRVNMRTPAQPTHRARRGEPVHGGRVCMVNERRSERSPPGVLDRGILMHCRGRCKPGSLRSAGGPQQVPDAVAGSLVSPGTSWVLTGCPGSHLRLAPTGCPTPASASPAPYQHPTTGYYEGSTP